MNTIYDIARKHLDAVYNTHSFIYHDQLKYDPETDKIYKHGKYFMTFEQYMGVIESFEIVNGYCPLKGEAMELI